MACPHHTTRKQQRRTHTQAFGLVRWSSAPSHPALTILEDDAGVLVVFEARDIPAGSKAWDLSPAPQASVLPPWLGVERTGVPGIER